MLTIKTINHFKAGLAGSIRITLRVDSVVEVVVAAELQGAARKLLDECIYLSVLG
jgi:hypothetical protein